MIVKNKYMIGTHVMFYEIEMVPELVQSIINAVKTVENRENITVELFFNMSQYFEKIDLTQITKQELRDKFLGLVEDLKAANCNVGYTIYEEDDEPITMVDYRRDLNYLNCKKHDYIIWGETDALLPKEMFRVLESIRDYADQNNISRYVTTFAVRKMWDPSWEPLEHVDFTDKEYYETELPDGSRDDRAFDEPHSIRYTMSIDEMNKVNEKTDELDVRIIQHPQFDGSGLVLSSDLIKNGVNVPHCIIGHAVDDTSMMHSCKQIMGDNYIQFIVKNILKVHNRNNPKKRNYCLQRDGKNICRQEKGPDQRGDWYTKLKDLAHFNISNFGPSQAKFKTYDDYEKIMGMQ